MARGTGTSRPEVDDLLLLTLSRPRDALAGALAILRASPSTYDASVAHQAVGIVHREFGDVRTGIQDLREALRLARKSGLAQRQADVLASLGLALIWAGRTRPGLTAFDQALGLSAGAQAGQVLHRRSIALYSLGRHAAALEDARRAVAQLRRADDRLWTARAVSHRGIIHHAMGLPFRADADFAVAERLFAETSQELESAYVRHNRGLVAYSLNDLPTALSYLAEAAERYQALEVMVPDLAIDRCVVWLAAGLPRDARAEADAALAEIDRFNGQQTKKAELLLIAAVSALAAGQPPGALSRAQAAAGLFRSQHSAWGMARAGLVQARAGYAADGASVTLLRRSARAAARLEEVGAAEAAQAHLLAGRVALELKRAVDADTHFAAAARSKRRGPALSRATGWLSEALRAEATGQQPHRQFAACRRGLEVLDEYRFTLGASELRAQATAHGSELALIAQRRAARSRQPRQLLAWSERWRASALAVPAVRPSASPQLNDNLAAFRQATTRLAQARTAGKPTAALERERRRWEGAVRTCALHAYGAAWPGTGGVDIDRLIGQLSSTRLIEIIEVDGVLQVLVCGNGRVRLFTGGRLADAGRAADFVLFALRRIARRRPGSDLMAALDSLRAAGAKLEQELLGPAARHLGDGPLVVVPPGRLHAVPWGVLPALRERAVHIAPSAGAWMRAHSARPPQRRRVVLARGPGLITEGAEVPAAAPLYDDITVLAGRTATARQVLASLDGAWLAHIAAHGTFRADSPLFSALQLADGPLTVYDFEQLRRGPYRLILPSCDSGLQAPAGADELLGLVSSLLPLGTAGIVAAVVPLNDPAVVPVMVDLHRHVRAGLTLAQALCRIRQGQDGEPVAEATAASLVALGAA